MTPDDVVWRLTSDDGRVVECVMRFAPGGVEVEIRADGAPIVVQRFTTSTEAIAWAEDAHDDFLG